MRIYSLDTHGASAEARLGATERSFAAMSMDERWVKPTVAELLERSIRIWEERFAHHMEDLLALPRDRTVIAEGPGAFPWLVHDIIGAPDQAMFLVPTPERREIVAETRWGHRQCERFPGVVDRRTALAKVRERDWLMDEVIVSACDMLGLRWERVDGSRELDASLAMLERQFAALLPGKVNA